jgi:hypothetical protein
MHDPFVHFLGIGLVLLGLYGWCAATPACTGIPDRAHAG